MCHAALSGKALWLGSSLSGVVLGYQGEELVCTLRMTAQGFSEGLSPWDVTCGSISEPFLPPASLCETGKAPRTGVQVLLPQLR